MITKRVYIFVLLLSLVCLSFQQLRGNSNYNMEQDHLQFLQNEKTVDMEHDDHHHHGAKWQFTKGFFRGLKIFSNVTHTDECGSIGKEIHDDIVDICSSFHNVTNYEELIESMKLVLDRLQRIGKKFEKVEPACKQVMKEVCQVLDRVKQHFQRDQQFRNIFVHIIGNLEPIRDRIRCARDLLNQHKFCESGEAYGELIKFALLWDFEISTLTMPSINERLEQSNNNFNYNFNRPPFSFE